MRAVLSLSRARLFFLYRLTPMYTAHDDGVLLTAFPPAIAATWAICLLCQILRAREAEAENDACLHMLN
jgi:hypothetical protein